MIDSKASYHSDNPDATNKKPSGIHRDQASTDDIQSALDRANGAWVSAKELSSIRIQYTRPVWEIRHERGIPVVNRTINVRGKKHSYYRIPAYAGQPDPPLPEQPGWKREGFLVGNKPTFTTPKPSPAEQRQMFESQFLNYETGARR